MPIHIKREDEGYSATVTPPHGRSSNWATSTPMEVDALIAKLKDLGCHQTDIGDALNAADPEWLSRRNA